MLLRGRVSRSLGSLVCEEWLEVGDSCRRREIFEDSELSSALEERTEDVALWRLGLDCGTFNEMCGVVSSAMVIIWYSARASGGSSGTMRLWTHKAPALTRSRFEKYDRRGKSTSVCGGLVKRKLTFSPL